MRSWISSLTFVMTACALFVTTTVQAEVKVTISKTHLCCPACFKAVDETLKDMEGVQYETNKEEKTITIAANNEAGAQKAIDALAKAGFHGKTDVAPLKFGKVKAPEGNVRRLEVRGIHNCCGACTQAIKKAVGGVEGVQAETVKPREAAFVVEGDFKAAAIVEALLNAGFHCQVQ